MPPCSGNFQPGFHNTPQTNLLQLLAASSSSLEAGARCHTADGPTLTVFSENFNGDVQHATHSKLRYGSVRII